MIIFLSFGIIKKFRIFGWEVCEKLFESWGLIH